MAKSVTLSEDANVNGATYAAGETLSVSKSIYDRLKSEGKIAEVKAPASRKPREG